MNKFNILKQYLVIKYFRKFKTKEQLETYQNKKIAKHLKYVVRTSPFYQELYKGYEDEIKINNWAKLPVVNKEIMMANFDTFNTVGIKKNKALEFAFSAEKTRDFSSKLQNISIGLSSGTSGNRGIFLVSDEESEMWSGAVLAKLLPGSILGRHTIAFFLRANNNLYSSTENGRIRFHYFDLFDDINSHLSRLQKIEPTILIGPPSMLRKIAEWQTENVLKLRPKKIISVAEVLEDIDRGYIEKVFGLKIDQVYQCTEGFLASTCSYGTLHINEDLVVVQKEYLDQEKGIFVPIITDFTRRTQPIIRYRLNDLLIEKKDACPCGSPYLALERIDGRCDDLFYGYTNNSKQIKVIFPDFIRRAIMKASDNISEYKVIQKDFLKIEVQFEVNTGHYEDNTKLSIIKELLELWEQLQLESPNIHFSAYNRNPSATKLRRVECHLKQQFEGKIH
ncbi:F390 synthetase-related protein [Metabacillus malikii]|uniref:Adenylate-forming enzyme n=1 Tax=Metabacillus malikii TaxID=1504265 RepID=A0ABT9ZJV1_9BACI|nr:F390 synthetase-related protein [Metabacillus malikii]MDQ0232571.1 putative adenylate-forming enzyme [Metabacillus malikii]